VFKTGAVAVVADADAAAAAVIVGNTAIVMDVIVSDGISSCIHIRPYLLL